MSGRKDKDAVFIATGVIVAAAISVIMCRILKGR